MNWFKETWWIIKQLFTKVKADKVEYKHMDHYPFSGYSAMSWCGYLLSRKPESQIKPTTWNHENIHLYEAKDKKRWISYYWSYVWEWIKGKQCSNNRINRERYFILRFLFSWFTISASNYIFKFRFLLFKKDVLRVLEDYFIVF